MAFTTTKTVGATGDFSTLQTWEDGAPINLTTAESWNANTFTGTFTQGEIVTGTGLTEGKFIDGNGSSYVSLGIVTGTTTLVTVLTGSTSGATCTFTTKIDTGGIWQGKIKNASDAFTTAATTLTVSGSTSSTTAYKELTTAVGASFRDNANVQTNALRYNTANGCSIATSAAYTTAINAAEANTRYSNLQITGNATNGSFGFSGAGTNQRMDSCIAIGATNNINNAVFGGGSMTGTFTNLLIYSNFTSGTSSNLVQTATSTFVNCTLAVPNDKTVGTNGFFASYGTTTIKNCAVFGVTNPLRIGTGSAYSTTTSYSNNAATGFTVVTYDTSTGSGFQNITLATLDLRIKSGSAMLDVGTTDATNAAIDIAGTARPQGSAYDVGCWELVSTGVVNKYSTLLMCGV